jgi:hypothetical protein
MRQKLQYMVVVERGATSYGAKEEFKTCSPIANVQKCLDIATDRNRRSWIGSQIQIAPILRDR